MAQGSSAPYPFQFRTCSSAALADTVNAEASRAVTVRSLVDLFILVPFCSFLGSASHQARGRILATRDEGQDFGMGRRRRSSRAGCRYRGGGVGIADGG